MGWLGKLLRITPKQDLTGIQLDMRKPYWALEGKTDFSKLLRALVDFLPDDSTLYFEGGSPIGKHLSFFEAHAIPEQTHVAVATLWPRPRCYHIPATSENLGELAELAKSCAAPELAVHFHVYSQGKVLLEWHDAFAQPLMLSGEIAESEIRNFSNTLCMRYTGKQEDGDP